MCFQSGSIIASREQNLHMYLIRLFRARCNVFGLLSKRVSRIWIAPRWIVRSMSQFFSQQWSAKSTTRFLAKNVVPLSKIVPSSKCCTAHCDQAVRFDASASRNRRKSTDSLCSPCQNMLPSVLHSPKLFYRMRLYRLLFYLWRVLMRFIIVASLIKILLILLVFFYFRHEGQ